LGKPVVSGDLGGSLLLSRVTSASIFCLKASYSGVPGRGGKSFGGPVRHVTGTRCESGRGNYQCNQVSHVPSPCFTRGYVSTACACDAMLPGAVWRPAGGLTSASPLRRSASMRLITFAGARRRVHSACCAFAASGQAAGRAAEQRDELAPFHARHGCLPTPCGGSRAPQPSTHGPAGPLSEIRDLLANRLPRVSFVVRQRCE